MLVLITGVSTGLGRAFAEALLQAGHRVIGTVRSQAAVIAFEAIQPGQALARVLDVTDERAITDAVADLERNIGPIDALINNAGYGHEGTLEESSTAELRRQFEVNVFGAVAMMQAVLPFMRQRRSGRILNITSRGGHSPLQKLLSSGRRRELYGRSKEAAHRAVRPLGNGQGDGRGTRRHACTTHDTATFADGSRQAPA